MGYAMRDKGGNQLLIAELTSAYALVTGLINGTNCLECGLVKSHDTGIDANVEKLQAEDGKTYGQDETYDGNTTGVLMETDKTRLDYLAYTVRFKTHLEVTYEGIKNGKHQEVFKIVNVTPQKKSGGPGGTNKMPYSSTALPPASAVTFSVTGLTDLETATGKPIYAPGPVVIPAGQEDVVVETAV